MGRQSKNDGDVSEFIRALVHREWSPPQIHKELKRQERFSERVPSLRQIQRLKAKLSASAPSSPWSLMDGNGEADSVLVLPVLAAVIEETKGRKTGLTKAEAESITRIRRVAPDCDHWYAYVLARLYLLREQAKMPSADIEAYLAFAPWRGTQEAQAYQQALEEGWVSNVPYMSSSVFREFEVAFLRRTPSKRRGAKKKEVGNG